MYYFNPLKFIKTCFMTPYMVTWVNIPCAPEILFASDSSQRRKDKLYWEQNGTSVWAEIVECSRLLCLQWLYWSISCARGFRVPSHVWLTEKCNNETGDSFNLLKEGDLFPSSYCKFSHNFWTTQKSDGNMICLTDIPFFSYRSFV